MQFWMTVSGEGERKKEQSRILPYTHSLVFFASPNVVISLITEISLLKSKVLEENVHYSIMKSQIADLEDKIKELSSHKSQLVCNTLLSLIHSYIYLHI